MDGYIIQEVNAEIWSSREPKEKLKLKEQEHYLEAWQVKKKSDSPSGTAELEKKHWDALGVAFGITDFPPDYRDHFHDVYWWKPDENGGPGTRGRIIIKGKVYFHFGEDENNQPVTALPKPFKPKGHLWAGGLPSVDLGDPKLHKDNKPPSIFTFFANICLTKPVDHNITVSWDCCDGKEHDTTIESRVPTSCTFRKTL